MASPRTEHVYVYCAVRGPVTGRAVAKLPPMPDGQKPRAIELTEDISLVVADVPASIYRGDAIEARLSDLDWVARAGQSHHAVADRLATRHTLVPFRLFTLFSSEARARSTLGRSADRIDEALDRVNGRAEWVLRISKPDPPQASSAEKPSRRLEPGKPRPAAMTTGTSFLKSKAAAKQAAKQTAARVRDEAGAVFDALEALAAQSTYRSIDPQAGLLLDASFLVPTDSAAAFKRVLTKGAAGLLKAGCRVSLTGPWPPYSFVALETRV